LGKSGSIVSAPGVVERRLMSRKASTSRWISYSEGCRVRVAMSVVGDERGLRFDKATSLVTKLGGRNRVDCE
jgi:hypothetical protein